MAQTKTPLDVWAHQRLTEIDLPSGAGKATVEAADITECILDGMIPNPLRAIAIKAEGGELNESKLDDDERRKWFDFQCLIVAKKTKEFKPTRGRAVKGPLEQEFVAKQMPPEDRVRIFATATHILTASQLMGVLSLSPFRGGEGLAGVAPGGEGNGASSE